MKISYNWLKQYLDIDFSVNELSEMLTSLGLEVEGIEKFESLPGGLKNFVVAKVLTCEPHPDADKLSITTVDTGDGNIYPIVCGAPNVAAGQTVIVAKVGAVVTKGNESFEIKKAKIRGRISEGMICAEDEIGIGTDHDGILVLHNEVQAGMPAADYFKVENDSIFEIGLTPNRADAASHIGVARDLAAYLKVNLNPVQLNWPSVDNFVVDNESNTILVDIQNTEACKRYSGITISNITVKESPDWLKNRLKSVGLKPINNIVDITNYILHELGQPLHAFDADKIIGKKVIVKTLPSETEFITLDDQVRKLNQQDLMICNQDEGMCIAGVFGGKSSGVSLQTRNIFIESAYFNPIFVRKTSKRHALQTDASFRFERGTDPNITVYALKRAALLIKEIAGGYISSQVIDVYPNVIKNAIVPLNLSKTNNFLGIDLSEMQFEKIAKALDMSIVEHEDDDYVLAVPPYRVDVTRDVDVAEEVLRVFGYNNVQFGDVVKSALAYVDKPDKEKMKQMVSDFLAARGFNEMMNISLSKADFYKNLNHYKHENLIVLENPLSNDLGVFRQSLLFGALQSVEHNIKRKKDNLLLFEFGSVASKERLDGFTKDLVKTFFESLQLALCVTGNIYDESWKNKPAKADFYFLKAQVENILERLGLFNTNIIVEETQNDIFDFGLAYQWQNAKDNFSPLANFGKVKDSILKTFEIDQDVYYAEFFWSTMENKAKSNAKYIEASKFPLVRRDLALLLDKKISYQQLRDLALQTERKLLTGINLFDVFEDKKLGEDKKSYALSFFLQDKTKTLQDKDIDKVMNKLIDAYKREFNAQLR